MRYIKIKVEGFWTSIPELPGIYFIYSLKKDNNADIVPRVLKSDKKGVLYIGKSENLRRRLKILYRSLKKEYKTSAHTFAEKYNKNKNIRNRFPFDTLAIRFICKSNPFYHERYLLKNHIREYGEMPPFNSKH